MERKVKVRLLALVGVAIGVGIGIAGLQWSARRAPQRGFATFDQIQERATGLKQSMGYKDGGRFLASEQGSPDSDPYRRHCILERALVDFASSIEPGCIPK